MLLNKSLVSFAAVSVGIFLMTASSHAQQTGGVDTGNIGGGTGGNTTDGGQVSGAGDSSLSAPSELVSQPDFEDIRREVSFAGQSLSTIVHPFSESFTLQSDFESIAGGNSAADNTAGARTTVGAGGNTVQSPFGGFNDPFQALFFSQFQTQQAVIRSRLSIEDSEFMPPPAGTVASKEASAVNARYASSINSHLRSLPNMQQANFQVTMSDGTAILEGSVESEARKKQLERLVKMEAGVQKVVNNLSVQ